MRTFVARAKFAHRYRAAVSSHIRLGLIGAGYHSRPGFLIVGAQKAGTTALYYYLANHQNILPSSEKELGFFCPEHFSEWPEHPNHAILCSESRSVFHDGPSGRKAKLWYHSHFPLPHELGRHGITFEATPEYIYYPAVPERIFSYDVGMKLIVLLRDPVERAFSAWNMQRSWGNYRPLIYAPKKETRDFEVAVKDEIEEILAGRDRGRSDYVRRGLYYEQIMRYLRSFPWRQIHVVETNELMANTGAVVDRVLRFLDLPPFPAHTEWPHHHVGNYERQIPRRSQALLQNFFRPQNERLFELLNHEFAWR